MSFVISKYVLSLLFLEMLYMFVFHRLINESKQLGENQELKEYLAHRKGVLTAATEDVLTLACYHHHHHHHRHSSVNLTMTVNTS